LTSSRSPGSSLWCGKVRAATDSDSARITVEPRAYGTQEIELPDIPQANPSPADPQRNARERVLLAKVFSRREGPPLFSLPLAKPANPLPEGKSFGVDRVFNGKAAAQPHMGSATIRCPTARRCWPWPTERWYWRRIFSTLAMRSSLITAMAAAGDDPRRVVAPASSSPAFWLPHDDENFRDFVKREAS
jgi:hypothetical protein